MKIKKKRKSNRKVLLTWVCLLVFAHILNSYRNVNTRELITPIDLRGMAYTQIFDLYDTVHIHVIKPGQTYVEVCNTADFHTCVSKIISLKNRTRVSIHNHIFLLIYDICKETFISSVFFPVVHLIFYFE